MAPNYNQGKIYKIISDKIDKIYIGSTTLKYLSTRLQNHSARYKAGGNVSSKKLFELGNCQIILLENYCCNSKDELTARERYYIEQNKNICVNIRCPNTTLEEKRNKIKEWMKNNKEKCKELNYKNREKNNLTFECSCGGKYKKYEIKKHLITNKHQKYIETNPNT
jgi:hypothetical protein